MEKPYVNILFQVNRDNFQLAVDNVSQGEGRLRLTCITSLPQIGGPADSHRTREKCYFTGYSEVVNYELTTDAPFVHRRVVFRAHARFDAGRLLQLPAGGLARQQAVRVDEAALQFLDGVFVGGIGLNPTDRFVTRLNSKNVTVISDERKDINPSGSGRIQQHRYWTSIDEVVVFADDGGMGNSHWLAGTAGAGNIYVMDLFSNRGGGDADGDDDEDDLDGLATVSSEGIIFFRE